MVYKMIPFLANFTLTDDIFTYEKNNNDSHWSFRVVADILCGYNRKRRACKMDDAGRSFTEITNGETTRVY